MLEIKFVRQNLSDVQKALNARGQTADLNGFQKCDEDRRIILQEIETLRHQRNVVSDQIAEMKKAGENADVLVTEMRDVATQIKELDKNLAAKQEQLDKILLRLPNLPHASVPKGKDDRCAVSIIFRRGCAIRAGLDQLHAGYSYDIPRLYGNLTAVYC
jgi:seryl-tRNA synthetase